MAFAKGTTLELFILLSGAQRQPAIITKSSDSIFQVPFLEPLVKQILLSFTPTLNEQLFAESDLQ